MTVAAVVRTPPDLVAPRVLAEGSYAPESWRMEVGPGYVRAMGSDLANYGYGVIGRVRPGQVDALAAAVNEIDSTAQLSTGNENDDVIRATGRGIDVETNALLVFALLALVTAVVLVGQAVGRRAQLDLDDAEALRSTGLVHRQRALVPLARALVVAGAGTAGAVMMAVALSPAFPIGVARRAEIDPGVEVDPLVVTVGGAALFTVLLAWAAAVSWRASRERNAPVDAVAPANRASRPLSALAAGAGAPVPVVEGVRMAFARGRGRTAVPVLGAAVATTTAVAVLCAILVFSASLDHLVASAELQGWTWDVTVGNLNSESSMQRAVTELRQSDEVAQFLGFGTGPLVVDGERSYGVILGPGRADDAMPVLDGRLPSGADEVAVGAETLQDLGRRIGETVRLSVGPGLPEREMRVVGTVVPPAGLDGQLTLGRGVVVTLEGATAVAPESGLTPQSFLVRFTPGTSVEEGTEALRPAFGDAIGPPRPPADVRNLSRVQRLPRLLALLVALMALGTLANVLVTSIRRHRRDLATLATLGFRRRQLATTVGVQATTFAVVALLVGLPLGIAAGRTVWRVVADSISSAAAPATPLAVLAIVALATLVAANLVAALPARAAARTRPATVLRSE